MYTPPIVDINIDVHNLLIQCALMLCTWIIAQSNN